LYILYTCTVCTLLHYVLGPRVLAGLGQTNLHSVEGCLVQPRLKVSTPGTDFKAKNAEVTVTTSDQDNDQDYVTLKHSLLEKGKRYLENLWL
jgi:hypothetical protein